MASEPATLLTFTELTAMLWTDQQDHGGMTPAGGGMHHDEYNSVTVKRGLYERTGVAEYWFVDLRDHSVLVHRRDPGIDQPARLGPGDTLTSPLLPGFAVAVEDLVPPFPG